MICGTRELVAGQGTPADIHAVLRLGLYKNSQPGLKTS
jgi:hypothetical protein